MGRTRPFGNIRKLSSGRFQARYYHLGRQVPAENTFATKADARRWLATMETEIVGGHHVDPTSGREPFGVFAQRWLEQRDLRPTTRLTYTSQLAHILADFEDVELAKISPPAVRSWHGRLSKSGLHPNTVAKIYRMFRTMLDTAVDDGLIRANPVHIKGAAAEKAAERPPLQWADVRRVANNIHPRFHALVWTAATSGLRFGELTGLARHHINLDAPSVRVEQALADIKGEGPTLGPPKSASAHRVVSIPTSTAELLANHIATYADPGPDAAVFTSLKGGPLLNTYFARHWRHAVTEAGLPKGTRFHDLRHLAGTTAASAGASLREIMARMGHASAEASLRYLNASERRDAEIAAAIERRMNEDLAG